MIFNLHLIDFIMSAESIKITLLFPKKQKIILKSWAIEKLYKSFNLPVTYGFSVLYRRDFLKISSFSWNWEWSDLLLLIFFLKAFLKGG